MGRQFDIIDGKCVIPEGITTILDEVWEGSEFDKPDVIFNMDSPLMKAIRFVEFPDTLKSIGDCVFFYCTSLEKVAIPGTVSVIGGQAFEGCSKLNFGLICSD